MKKVLLSSVLLSSLLVGCSQQEENNQFSVTCQDDEGCYFDYHNQDKVVGYSLDYNETLYFNYPDEGRIRLSSWWQNTKIYSTEEIITDNNEIVKINENEIILLD